GPQSPVDLLSAVHALADAYLHVLAVRLALADPDAGRPLAHGAHDHHVADRQRRRLVDHAAGRHRRAAHPARVLDRPRLRVSLGDVEVLDDDLAVLRPRVDHSALLASVLAAQYVDEVALPDAHGLHELEHLRSEGDNFH